MKAKLKISSACCFQILFFTLFSALSFQLSGLIFCHAWAESKALKMPRAVQKTVYDAQQAIKRQEYKKAEEYLKKYIKKHPQKKHYMVEFVLGNTLALMGKEKEALAHYQRSADLYPEYNFIWQNMGKIHFDLKQYEQAGDCFLKAYEIAEEKDPQRLYNAAVSYIMAGKGEKALPHLEYLASWSKKAPKIEWLEALVRVCIDLELEKKAFETIHVLLDRDENNPRWWKLLSQFYLRQNDYKKALAALTIHSYLIPEKKDDVMLLGDLASVAGAPLIAAKYYETALHGSNMPVCYKKLASAYIAAHRPAKALEALERGLKKNRNAKLGFMMGQVLYGEERFDNAYDAFAQSAGLDPKNGRAYLLMGYCALYMDKNDAAKTAFQKAERFPKQRKAAKKALRHICLISTN